MQHYYVIRKINISVNNNKNCKFIAKSQNLIENSLKSFCTDANKIFLVGTQASHPLITNVEKEPVKKIWVNYKIEITTGHKHHSLLQKNRYKSRIIFSNVMFPFPYLAMHITTNCETIPIRNSYINK